MTTDDVGSTEKLLEALRAELAVQREAQAVQAAHAAAQDARLAAQEAAMAEQQARLSSQEAELAALRRGADLAPADERRGSRRDVLRLAGGAAAGVLAGTVLRPGAAAASDGNQINLAQTNVTNSTDPASTIIDYTSLADKSTGQRSLVVVTENSRNASSVGTAALTVLASGATKVDHAIIGQTATTEANKAGVVGVYTGQNPGSSGVLAIAVDRGNALVAGTVGEGYSARFTGLGRIGMNGHLPVGPPTSKTYGLGDLIRDDQGNLWHCVAGGEPGTWRKLSGPSTSGQLHLLDAPVRVLDTRSGTEPATINPPKAALAAATDRVVNLTQGTNNGRAAAAVPAGATGALVNMVIVNNESAGWLAIWKNGIPWPGHTNVNTFGANQILAATTVTALDGAGNAQLRAFARCDVVIDVIGFYR